MNNYDKHGEELIEELEYRVNSLIRKYGRQKELLQRLQDDNSKLTKQVQEIEEERRVLKQKLSIASLSLSQNDQGEERYSWLVRELGSISDEIEGCITMLDKLSSIQLKG